VGHLPAGVDARVGPAGDRQRDRDRKAQNPAERLLQDALDAALAGLGGPAMKA
jgi:hypothetical protein